MVGKAPEAAPSGKQDTPPGRSGQAPLSPLALLVLLATVCVGFVGLIVSPGQLDGRAATQDGVLARLYHSVGLLTHDSGWAFDPAVGTRSGLFQLLAVIAPVLTAATLAYIVSDWLRPATIRLAAFARVVLGQQNAVALIGLTDNSFALAVSVRANAGERVVPLIFTDETSGRLLDRCRRYGIATYPRHGTGLRARLASMVPGRRRSRLPPLNAVMNRAQDLISFLPSADGQVDFLAELAAWSPRGGRKNSRAWLLLEDRGLAQRLEGQSHRFCGNESTPRLLSIATLAARQLLMSQPFDTLADAFGQAQLHLAIYGMGALGRAIVKEAAQLYVTRPSLLGTKLRITFFDADAAAGMGALLAEDPGLGGVVELTGHDMRIEAAGLMETQVAALPEHVTAHIITFEKAEDAFCLAVSLRRWLLEAPEEHRAAWLRSHHAAPIFVRAPSWHGLGRLFYRPAPGQDRAGRDMAGAPAPLPDGIFGFGAIEGLFGSPEMGVQHNRCLLDKQGETGARAVHAAYTQTRSGVDVSLPGHAKRAGEVAWHTLSPQLRESNFRAYDHMAIKARAVGHRLVSVARADATGQPAGPALEPEAISVLEQLEHRRYLAERSADGWRYAPRRMDAVCVHPDLVDWSRLDLAERRLDRAQVHVLGDIAHAAGQRFARALVIGVIGHRPDRIGAGAARVRAAIEAQLRQLLADNAARAPLLLTALAPGADTLAAEAALALHIPFMAPLPLPYELYREDFQGPGEKDTFHRLAAAAELHVELPLRFGRASEMTTNPQPAEGQNVALRARQYALAGAYIVERADVLIAVSDGQGSNGTGGTHEVLSWWNGEVPEEFATRSPFFAGPTARGEAIIIGTDGAIVQQAVQAGQGRGPLPGAP